MIYTSAVNTTTYSKGTTNYGYVRATTTTYGTNTNGQRASDGYWYVYKGELFTPPPETIILPDVIRGGKRFTVSWSDYTGGPLALAGYKLEKSVDGGTTWAQIYQGTLTGTEETLAFGTQTVTYRVKAYDTGGFESGYTTSPAKTVVNNNAPSKPPSITVPLTVMGGREVLVCWEASNDADGNLVGYALERRLDEGEWQTLYTGDQLSHQDFVEKGAAAVIYRVCAKDAYGDCSDYATSPVRAVNNNSAPVITCDVTGDLGEKTEGFSVAYSVADADEGDTITVTEKLDGTVLRQFEATEAPNTLDLTEIAFTRVLNGPHTLALSASDGKETVTHSLTFTKAVHAASITLAEPLPSGSAIAKTVLSVTRSLPSSAEFTVLLSNNAYDASPTWEDATQNVLSGLNYVFENTTVTAVDGEGNPRHGYNFAVSASRGESGVGGYISAIGGAFQDAGV